MSLRNLLKKIVPDKTRRALQFWKKIIFDAGRFVRIHAQFLIVKNFTRTKKLRNLSVCDFHILTHENASHAGVVLKSLTLDQVSASPKYYGKNTGQRISSRQVTKSICLIKNAEISYDSNAIKANGSVFLENFNFEWGGNISAPESRILYVDKQNVLFSEPALRAPAVLLPSAIKIFGSFSWNYYHYLIDCLSKFQLLEDFPPANRAPVIVDAVVSRIPQFQELLDYFRKERDVIYIDKNQSFLVEELYVVSSANDVAPNVKNASLLSSSDNWYSGDSLEFLGMAIPRKGSGKGEFPKRIFLSRKLASNRRTFNEEKVYAELMRFGFELVNIENYSVSEQAYLFSNAEVIVTGSGAALVNMIFCSEKCLVVCLVNYDFDISLFSTLALLRKVELIYVHTSSVDFTAGLHENFEADVESLREILESYVKN